MSRLNPFFTKDGVVSEQRLHEDLIIEAIQIHGHDVYYLPREIVNLDTILNEDILSRFSKKHLIECYIETYDDYEGDGTLISKFGLEIRNNARISIAKRRFSDSVVTGSRPKEGDLIYFPAFNGLFEITYVDGEKPFHQFANLPKWTITIEQFEYSSQKLDTGYDGIDNFESRFANSILVKDYEYNTGADVTIREDFEIELPSGIKGKTTVLEVLDDGTLKIRTPKFPTKEHHKLVKDSILRNAEKELLLTNDATYNDDDFPEFINQNKETAKENDDFLDWSENNPFGEPR
ncbi:MAG: hypothetical protein LAT55_13795 [Opitutales bacterium]|nr:hypothetical protein [Opitutales bacterium]